MAAVVKVKDANKVDGTPSIHISNFPAEVHQVLQEVDDEGNGYIELDELSEIFLNYKSLKDNAKNGQLYLGGLPDEIQQACKAFDSDGSGTIHSSELARAAQLLEESKQHAKRLMRVLLAVGCTLLLLLAGIGALVSVVVELSKEAKVGNDGVMTVSGSTQVVKTKSAETFVDETGTLRTAANATRMVTPGHADMIDIAYNTPLEIFSRLETVTVVEPTFEAIASVTGVVRDKMQLVLSTDHFKVRMLKTGNSFVELLDDDFDKQTSSDGSRHLLQDAGVRRGRKLLQATNPIVVKVTDEYTGLQSARDATYVTAQGDAKCSNTFPISASSIDGCIAEVVKQLGSDCDNDPVLFGYSQSGECYCVPKGEDCNMDPEAQPGWDVNLISVPSAMQSETQEQWEEELGATDQTPIPEDSRIRLVATGEICMAVKVLSGIDADGNGNFDHDLDENGDGIVDQVTSFMTVDECMYLALQDPDCLHHGPTIQFHDYGAATFFASSRYHGWHCACSRNCKEDHTRLVRKVTKDMIRGTTHYHQDLYFNEEGTCSGTIAHFDKLLWTHKSLSMFSGNKPPWVPEGTGRWPNNEFPSNYMPTQDWIPYGSSETKKIKDRQFWDKWVGGNRGRQLYGDSELVDVYSFRRIGRPIDYKFGADAGTCLEEENRYQLKDVDHEEIIAGGGAGTTNVYTWTGADTCATVNVGSASSWRAAGEQYTLQGAYLCPAILDTYPGKKFHVIQDYHKTSFGNTVGKGLGSNIRVVLAATEQEWDDEVTMECCYPKGQEMWPPPKATVYIGSNPVNEEAPVYEHRVRGCVNGHDIEKHSGKTVEECQELCTAHGQACEGIQFGVAHGGDGVAYSPGDCTLSSSANTKGCDGGYHNLDFYKKVETLYTTAGPGLTPCGGEGDDIHSEEGHTGKTLDDCKRMCSETSGCNAFSFNAVRSECLLRSNKDACEDSYDNTCTDGTEGYQYYTAVCDADKGVKRWWPAEVEKGYKCPPTVNKDNWLGGYTGDEEFFVKQEGTKVEVRLIQGGQDCSKWDMHLQFECEEGEAPEAEEAVELVVTGSTGDEEPQCKTVTLPPHPDMPPYGESVTETVTDCLNSNCTQSITHTVTRSGDRMPNFYYFWYDGVKDGYYCPVGLMEIDGMQFYNQQHSSTRWKIFRWSSNREGWKSFISFECCRPDGWQPAMDCTEVHVGDGDNNKNDKKHFVPQGYTCPGTVSRLNWANEEQYGEKFHVSQTFTNDFTGSELAVQRGDVPGSGWSMDLKFECCATEHVANCHRMKFGSNINSGDSSVTRSVPDGYTCPQVVNRDNWHGGYPFDYSFLVLQHQTSVTVVRAECGVDDWDINLEFDCCKDVPECTCVNPGGRAGDPNGGNGYTCNDLSSGSCSTYQECFTPKVFKKGDWGAGCRDVPIPSCTCVNPGGRPGGPNGGNQIRCDDGSSSYCGANEQCYATDPFQKDDPGSGCRRYIPMCTCTSPGGRAGGPNGGNQFLCDDGTGGYCGSNEECYAADPWKKGDFASGCRA